MPQITVRKSISYTDIDSGASYDLSTSKVKVGRHAYRQTLNCGDGVIRRIIEVGTSPNYQKLIFCQVKNVGAFDLELAVNSGTGIISVIVPPGRVWEVFNTNFWNDASASNPDTIDEITGEGMGGETKVKVDALFA